VAVVGGGGGGGGLQEEEEVVVGSAAGRPLVTLAHRYPATPTAMS
jgi:hypothetical protein